MAVVPVARRRYRLLWGDKWLSDFDNKGAFWGGEDEAYDIDNQGTADTLRGIFEQRLRDHGFPKWEITIVCISD